MPNNRHLINDFELVRPPRLLDKGFPLPGLEGRYVVEEGQCAIITEGGAFKEILDPGNHFLGKYHFWRDIKAIPVDTRLKTLAVSTTREFTIDQPVPIQINLDLSAEYQVVDPRRVAMEIGQPLTALYDRVIQAVRGAVVYATIEEVRKQGEGIARIALQRLQAMKLLLAIGMEVRNVLVTAIKATDAGTDVLAAQQLKEFTTVRDWQLDASMMAQSRITPEWLAVHRPEIYQQILAGNQALLKEMIDKGLYDPAGVLAQPAGAAGATLSDPLRAFNSLAFPGLQAPAAGATPGTAPYGQPSGYGQPALGPGAQAQLPPGSPPPDGRTRINEEIGYLQSMPGASVENSAGVGADGSPDGSYFIKIDLPRSSGGRLTLYLECSARFPAAPPTLQVELDEQETPFQSAVLRRWTGQQYLVEVAREAKQYFG